MAPSRLGPPATSASASRTPQPWPTPPPPPSPCEQVGQLQSDPHLDQQAEHHPHGLILLPPVPQFPRNQGICEVRGVKNEGK